MFKILDIRMAYLSKREKTMLLALSLVLMLFIHYRYSLGPQIQSYRAGKTELQKVRAQAAQVDTIAGSIQVETDAIKAVSQRLEKVRTQFTINMRDGSIVFLLGQWAIEDHVNITSYQPGLVDNKGAYLELPLKIGLRGDYRDVLTLVKQVEEKAVMTEIRYLNIKPLKPSTSKDNGAEPGASDQSVPLQQDGTVMAELNLVMYSDVTPQGQLVLDEMSRWPVGKGNAFRSTDFHSTLVDKQVAGPTVTPAYAEKTAGRQPENIVGGKQD